MDADTLATVSNPYRTLLAEKLAGKVTLDEFLAALYTLVVNDRTLLSHYRFRSIPLRPRELADQESRLKERLSERDSEHARELEARARRKMRVKFSRYFSSLEAAEGENASNMHFLREMHAFLGRVAPSHAGKILSVIETHTVTSENFETAGYKK